MGEPTETSPTFKIQRWDIGKLIPYEKNAKNHDDGQVEALARSIKTYGWDQPIVVDKNGVIIKGHGRRLAAIRLGIKSVPVIVRSDLSDAEVRAARLADNKVAALSGIDEQKLREELRELADFEIDFSSMGFSDEEITKMFEMDEPTIDDMGIGDEDEYQGDGEDDGSGDAPHTPKEAEYKRAFQIVVECADEADQESVYSMLTDKGYACKVLSM